MILTAGDLQPAPHAKNIHELELAVCRVFLGKRGCFTVRRDYKFLAPPHIKNRSGAACVAKAKIWGVILGLNGPLCICGLDLIACCKQLFLGLVDLLVLA